MHRVLLSAVLSLSILLSTLVAAQDASYTFTTIDPGGCGTPFGVRATTAEGINNQGQIVGICAPNGAIRAFGFVYDKGTFTFFVAVLGFGSEQFPVGFTEPHGINDRGQIVGAGGDSMGRVGFLYEKGQFTTVCVPLSGSTVLCSTALWGINNQGQIVGSYRDGSGVDHGFLYDDGEVTELDIPGATHTSPQGINNRGQIVGFYRDGSGVEHGFLYDDGKVTELDIPGATHTSPQGINDQGEIVGSYTDSSGGVHGFLYDDGEVTVLDVPGATDTFAQGINDQGEIVGSYTGADSLVHGFLAKPNKKKLVGSLSSAQEGGKE